jgi:hypothetical protein
MKKLILLLVITFSIVNGKCKAYNKRFTVNNYIEFVHIGVQNATIHPLIIGTEKPVINLSISERENFKRTLKFVKKKWTPELESAYISSIYNIVVTDKKSFIILKRFLTNNQQFYIDKKTALKVWQPSYVIHVGEQLHYYVNYKLKEKFISDLKQVLIKNNCDRHILEMLSYR